MIPGSRAVILLLCFLVPTGMCRAVQNISNGSFNTSDPTDASIANWDTGWAQPDVEPAGESYVTGWDYVGQVNGASGVYLGNGWVLTAAHVSGGDFTLDGITYGMVDGSDESVGSSDLTLFQISSSPNRPGSPGNYW
jgi:hypothetical protein